MILCPQPHQKKSSQTPFITSLSCLITNGTHLVTLIAINNPGCQTHFVKFFLLTGRIWHLICGIGTGPAVCVWGLYYTLLLYENLLGTSPKPHPLSCNCPKWNVKLTEAWIRAFFFFSVLKARDRKWVKWWMMSMLVGVFVEDSELSSLLCSKAQDYPKTASSTKPICCQKERLSLCVKKRLMLGFPASPSHLVLYFWECWSECSFCWLLLHVSLVLVIINLAM